MTYYSGPATIIQRERRIALSNCAVDVIEARPDQLGEWWGDFELAEAFDDPEPDEATLELEDGRKGKIIVTRVVVSAACGEFQGTGPPPTGETR